MIPEDIRTVYSILVLILPELTDSMAVGVREWRAELRAAIRAWRKGEPEPDWQSFRDWMNCICREDGMPLLFPHIPPEPGHSDE